VLLRWTAAFKEKWQKLQEHQRKGIVGPDDAYVIAISGVQLGSIGSISMDYGISGLPLAVETVFPVGPLSGFGGNETAEFISTSLSRRCLPGAESHRKRLARRHRHQTCHEPGSSVVAEA
jgi:hypothetical protein